MSRFSVMFYRAQGSLSIKIHGEADLQLLWNVQEEDSDWGANCPNTEMPAILMRRIKICRVIGGRKQTASVHHAEPLTNHPDMNLRVHSLKLTEKGNRWVPCYIKDVETDENNQVVKTAIK